jgi:hypothetical protein
LKKIRLRFEFIFEFTLLPLKFGDLGYLASIPLAYPVAAGELGGLKRNIINNKSIGREGSYGKSSKDGYL